jgi:hypothetical protein
VEEMDLGMRDQPEVPVLNEVVGFGHVWMVDPAVVEDMVPGVPIERVIRAGEKGGDVLVGEAVDVLGIYSVEEGLWDIDALAVGGEKDCGRGHCVSPGIVGSLMDYTVGIVHRRTHWW